MLLLVVVLSRESFFCRPYRYVYVREDLAESLAEGTSYLRIVFASADYCLTCSVALSCFRGSVSSLRSPSLAHRVYLTCVYVRVWCGVVCIFRPIHSTSSFANELIIDLGRDPRSKSSRPYTRLRLTRARSKIHDALLDAFHFEIKDWYIYVYPALYTYTYVVLEHYRQLRDPMKIQIDVTATRPIARSISMWVWNSPAADR